MTTYSAAAVAYTAIHSKAYTELYMYNAHEVITCTSSFLFSRPPGLAGVRLSVFAQYFFISAAEAVAKYCDECVCLCVCGSVCLPVRQDISGTSRAIFTIFVHVAYVRGSILL